MALQGIRDNGKAVASKEQAPKTVAGKRRWLSAKLVRVLTILLAVLAIVAGVATYVVLTGTAPIDTDPQNVVALIYVDLVILLLISVFVIRKIVGIWAARRRGSAGSQLHVRLVMMFGALSVLPAIVVSIFSLLFFDLGLESWFSQRVRTALSESQAIAEAYLAEHQKNIQGDALQIARDISRDAAVLDSNPRLLERALNFHTQLREVTEAIIFNPVTGIKARSGLTFVLELEPLSEAAIEDARNGEVVFLRTGQEDRVLALVKLDNFLEESFLLVGRYVDPRVLVRTERTRDAVAQFERLERERSDIQVTFALSFILVAMLLLLAAVWLGLNFASQLTQPISMLIAATEKIRSGELSARVPELSKSDEMGTLSRAFNRMTSQLESQRAELVEAARQIDERRRFTEAVLTGVTVGVIGIDEGGRINLPNRSASNLVGIELEELIGHELGTVVPELAGLLEAARNAQSDRLLEQEIRLERNGETKNLFVRVEIEKDEERVAGFVVTLDDISDLLSAQRKAAWADVARRIAHEIKNPLTPIQLSAERLRRKYLAQVQNDPETFKACIDTIIRQVDDIGRMVSEFSSFARMPKPTMQTQNILDLCRQAVFLQKNANQHINYEIELPDGGLDLYCDGRQLSQVLTNLLQNACDAIEGRTDIEDTAGQVAVRLYEDGDNVSIEVEDNGKGLPQEGRDRLTEPYMTTRKKGTGLGLAIVKKIMEDHKGRLTIADSPHHQTGTLATLTFSISALSALAKKDLGQGGDSNGV